jgi:adenylate kinase family enzyme
MPVISHFKALDKITIVNSERDVTDVTKDTVSLFKLPHADHKIVFVIGGPGTGKGTQCKKLVKEFGYSHISIGDIFRDEIKKETDLGNKLKEDLKNGLIVSLVLYFLS